MQKNTDKNLVLCAPLRDCPLKDLGLALEPKMCPDQSQAFIEVNNSQAFTVGRKKINIYIYIYICLLYTSDAADE